MQVDDFDLFDSDDTALSAAVLTQKSLIDTQERLGSMLDVMPMGLLIHTEQGILFANQEVCRLLKADKARLLGQHLLDFIRASDLDKVSAQFRSSFLGGTETMEQETVVERQDGSQRLVKLISGRLPWEGNTVIQILLQDITDQKRAENSLRQLTITDELTGAYNRRHAFYEAALYIEGEARGNVPLSVILIDIDHFKDVNDTYGHATGDVALKELTNVANVFIPTVPGTDSAMFARIGGEEFLLLLPGIELDGAMKIAESFRKAIEQLRIPLDEGMLRFNISSGVAMFRAADKTFDGVLSRADAALYEAKSTGRNRVCRAD